MTPDQLESAIDAFMDAVFRAGQGIPITRDCARPGVRAVLEMQEPLNRKLADILNRSFDGGTRVTNCVPHMYKDWHDRPKECEHCITDMANTLNYATRVNNFLNQQIGDARQALASIEGDK